MSRLLAAALLGFSLAACGGGGSSGGSNAPAGGSTPPPTTPPPTTSEPDRPPVPSTPPSGPDYLPSGKGWNLVWSDEFDGTALDDTKWSAEEACWGGGNNERQCYTQRQDNVEVVNGVLRLVALEESFTGSTLPVTTNPNDTATNTQPYTSGQVRSIGKASWTYGRISVRAKLPSGQGTWPAIWMLADSETYGTVWPLHGEIDIMEAVNLKATCSQCGGSTGENRTSSAIHFGSEWPNNQFVDEKTPLPGEVNPADGYHVYSVEWAEGIMQFFVDDVLHFTVRNFEWYTDHPAGAGNPNAPFDAPFYLIMNLAIGGNWPESVNDGGVAPDVAPSQMLVDWVRVYECTGDTTAVACLSN
ncbi:glycoside hydrolase family 16 protein [Parvularcula lutaonensis]|uniref:Family 16 glycosylhydrolase n=1 Tax=Parvularcula lutaonensis TaxID=491923 RepID=A0ABV7M933_9PROT|nr:glycoside hydrolase family 16 protein [Parvularcula lutaonensis]